VAVQVAGEQIYWRSGTSGQWTNPYNWVTATNTFRLPGPSDDVVITGWTPQYLGSTNVFLEVRNQPVQINSLTLMTCSQYPPCMTASYYWNYNGTQSQWDQYTISLPPFYCFITLVVVGPTQLIINQNLVISENSLIQLTNGSLSFPLDLSLLSSQHNFKYHSSREYLSRWIPSWKWDDTKYQFDHIHSTVGRARLFGKCPFHASSSREPAFSRITHCNICISVWLIKPSSCLVSFI
jgi:hypothetical protein